ncbi:MAG: tetratricopeptide repeat protein [Pseudomonadota bacterium]
MSGWATGYEQSGVNKGVQSMKNATRGFLNSQPRDNGRFDAPSRLGRGFRLRAAAPLATFAFGAAVLFSSGSSLAEENADEVLAPSSSLAGNYLAARIASTDSDTANAVNYYRAAIALDPDNVDLKLKGFLNFIANGNFAEGVETGRDIAKAGQEPEIVSIILAVDDLRRKNWAGAERSLEKDWRSALDRLMAGLVLSWVQVGQEKFDEALKTVDGLKGPAWFDLFAQYHGGLVALAAGDTKGAIKRLETAYGNRAGGQAANETYVRVIEALAHSYFRDGNVDQARSVVIEALQRQPQNPVFEQLLGDIESGKVPPLQLVKAQRGAAEVFLNLGTAINKEGGKQFARIYLQLARVLGDKDDAIASKLAELLDGEQLLEEANALFETIPESSPYYRIARLEIALNLDSLGDLEQSLAQMELLLESGPDDLVTYLSYGAVLARHEKYDDAIGVYNRALERVDNPTRVHWNLYYRVGIAYERTKQWPLAEAAFKKALELFPDQPSVLNYLGYSWIDMNINLQEGLDMIRKAVQLRPNDGYIVDSLGWAYYRLKRYEEAVVQLERAVELRPGDPTINDHLGDAYWRAKRRLEATFQWQHALALDPPADDIPKIKRKLELGLDEAEKLAKPDDATAEEPKPDNG